MALAAGWAASHTVVHSAAVVAMAHTHTHMSSIGFSLAKAVCFMTIWLSSPSASIQLLTHFL